MLCDKIEIRVAVVRLCVQEKHARIFYFASLQDVPALLRVIPRAIEDEVHSHILIALIILFYISFLLIL